MLVKELQSLALDVDVLKENVGVVNLDDNIEDIQEYDEQLFERFNQVCG